MLFFHIDLFLYFICLLFVIGILGVFLTKKNIIIILMSIELILLSINMNFVFFSLYLDDVVGQLFCLLILTVAAAEAAIGLAIIIIYYRLRGTIAISYISALKG